MPSDRPRRLGRHCATFRRLASPEALNASLLPSVHLDCRRINRAACLAAAEIRFLASAGQATQTLTKISRLRSSSATATETNPMGPIDANRQP